MYRHTTVLFAAAALLTAIPGIVGGQAQAGVEKILDERIKGGAVSGDWSASDACTYTSISIQGQEERGEAQNITTIFLYQSNWCNNTSTFLSSPYTAQGVLVAPTNKLLSAEILEVVFPVERCDYSSETSNCTLVEARLSAKWTGFGNTYQGHVTAHERYGPPSDKFVYFLQSRQNSAQRDATAEMQLEIDGIPVEFSSGYARLQYVNNGAFMMYRLTP